MCKISDHRIKVNLFKWKLTLGWITLLLQMTSVAIGPELSSLISRWIFARFLEMVSNCSGDKSWLSFRDSSASLMLSIHWNWGSVSCAQSKLHMRAILPEASKHKVEILIESKILSPKNVLYLTQLIVSVRFCSWSRESATEYPETLCYRICWCCTAVEADHRLLQQVTEVETLGNDFVYQF